jgi:hypothetical protein
MENEQMTDTLHLDEDGIPIPVTSNGWHPIEAFNHEADYAAEPFLVWFADGTWAEGYIEDGRFMGEWRHVVDGPGGNPISAIADREPIAFKIVEGPDLGGLKEIVEIHFKKAA